MRLWLVWACTSFVILASLAATAQGPQAAPSAQKASQAVDSTTDIPLFHAESRQILVGAIVWNNDKHIDSTLEPDLEDYLRKQVRKNARAAVAAGVPHPARGLAAKDFHILDNGVEQKINYFKEVDFVDADITGQWTFEPTTRGMWGVLNVLGDRTTWNSWNFHAHRPAMTSYLLGYVPAALAPGECRTIKVGVNGRDVRLSRDRYCNRNDSEALGSAVREGTTLGAQMRSFAASKARGTLNVSAQAFAFRSSGVVHLVQHPVPALVGPANPAPEFRYVIEVHDTKAPARVQIATEFASPNIRREYHNGSFHLSLHVLGMVYTVNGDLAAQFGDSYENDQQSYSVHINGLSVRVRTDDSASSFYEYYNIPRRYDTQVDLPPGDYELRIVVSDGKKNFGRARVPLRVERFGGEGLSISDIALSDIFRNASEILEDAAVVSPAPLIPTPLVSKDAQFFPAVDSRFKSGSAVSLYFEIYEPLLEKQDLPVYFEMRVTNLKSGELKVNTGPMSADKWIQPGNAVIPIAVELAMKMLPKGSYKLEVRASDSAGRVTPWRQADFTVK